jgi:hypothetical protein
MPTTPQPSFAFPPISVHFRDSPQTFLLSSKFPSKILSKNLVAHRSIRLRATNSAKVTVSRNEFLRNCPLLADARVIRKCPCHRFLERLGTGPSRGMRAIQIGFLTAWCHSANHTDSIRIQESKLVPSILPSSIKGHYWVRD